MKKISLENMVKIRHQLGYMQTEVAEYVGVSKHTWCRKEQGLVRMTLKDAFAVAELFKMPIDEIFICECD